jgi:hypothetical protein
MRASTFGTEVTVYPYRRSCEREAPAMDWLVLPIDAPDSSSGKNVLALGKSLNQFSIRSCACLEGSP